MDWQDERELPVPAEAVLARLGAGRGRWLRPFLLLAVARSMSPEDGVAPGGEHWYRLDSVTEGAAALIWHPPPHPRRFVGFRGRLTVGGEGRAVLGLAGTTDGQGDDEGDARALRTLLDLLAAAFAGLDPEEAADADRISSSDSG